MKKCWFLALALAFFVGCAPAENGGSDSGDEANTTAVENAGDTLLV